MRGVGWEADVTSRDPTLDAVGTRSCAIRRGMSKKRATAIFDLSLRVGFGLEILAQIPKFGIVLVLVVVLVLGAWDSVTAKRSMELICSVSLITKRSGFSSTRTTPQIRNLDPSRFR